MSGRCAINRDCKLKPIKDFYKTKDPEQITQYIGIAIDEPQRLERLKIGKPKKISLLEKYEYTEQMAFDVCKKNNLLSPIYDFAPRGGVGFVQMQDTVNSNICDTITKLYGIGF